MVNSQVVSGIDAGLKDFTAKYEGLDSEVVDDLRRMLIEQMKLHVKDVVVTSAKSGAKRAARKKTAYNLYIKAMFHQEELERKAKEEQGEEVEKQNSQELMSKFSKQWKTLPDEEKLPYEEEAKSINEESDKDTPAKSRSSGKKKQMTGYNLFYKENKNDIKASLEEGEALMKKVGATWKALSVEEQQEYKKRASELATSEE